MVAGTGSGVGKTVVTLAIIESLVEGGYDVQPFKSGPDFIDPSHHEAVAGKRSRNLDLFLMGSDGVARNFSRGSGDVAVVEGVMGLYDGGESSTAALAAELDLPVLLVLDGSSTSESAAAVAHGFSTYGDVDVVGALANRAGSADHAEALGEALSKYDLSAVLPRVDGGEIPDRHLGLYMSDEATLPEGALSELAELLEPEELVSVAREPEIDLDASKGSGDQGAESDVTVGVALDEAFRFYYPSNVEKLRREARVTFFSPLRSEIPEADAFYLGGGYPELHAGKLSRSGTLERLGARAAEGAPVYGECGGMMALAETLETEDSYGMAGVLPLEFRMEDELKAIGYVEAKVVRDSPVATRSETIRGHEFHYSVCEPGRDARAAYAVERGSGVDGQDGFVEHSTLGAYTHVHAEGCPGFFERLVDEGRRYSRS